MQSDIKKSQVYSNFLGLVNKLDNVAKELWILAVACIT